MFEMVFGGQFEKGCKSWKEEEPPSEGRWWINPLLSCVSKSFVVVLYKNLAASTQIHPQKNLTR
jgi:hypothetical protein